MHLATILFIVQFDVHIFCLALTDSIRIVADCGALSCQVTQKLKRDTTLEFTTVSAIIFIHCCAIVLFFFIDQLFHESAQF